MSAKKPSHPRVIIASITSLLILIFAGWLFFNQQYVKDQLSVWGYDAPADIRTLEENANFSSQGRFYFQATQPEIAKADTFNQDCPRQETGSPILGCYTEGRIFIFDITNTKLDGIEEVTAAHEMLHAVWERTSPSEQQRIRALLRTEYAKLSDADLKERMDYYARAEPGELDNELHSIIGTEVDNISPELEQYYARFFADRQTVLTLHSKYDSVFKTLHAQADKLYTELVKLGKSIEARSSQYNNDVVQLSADIEEFNSRADSGSFSSLNEFYQERAALLARSSQLEADRNAINDDIDTYDSKYKQYQALALQIEDLNSSIDSFGDLKPAPSL